MTMTKEGGTTDRVLMALRMYYRDHGYSPTLQELSDICELSGKGQVKYHLDQLVIRGLVEKTPRGYRPAERKA